MPANYVLLEKITVGAAGAASVTFSGIPQTGYTDLVVKMSTRTSASSITGRVYVAFNGVGTNQTRRLLLGNGSSASSGSANDIATDRGTGNSATASTFSNMEMYIPNYTSANNKSVSIDAVGENNATEAYAGLIAGLWSSTAAITEMTLSSSDGGNFVQGTTFYLYGVAKLGTTPVIVPYATGGDTIMTDGTYWYHAFKSSGTFTPAKGLSCDVLVVAGGGGGGRPASGAGFAGGGGAGGVLAYAAQSIATGSAQTITIGAGGGINANGSNSQFASLTASIGGGAGGGINTAGSAGGNGGGGGENSAGGTGSQGFNGGAGSTLNTGGGGGGGGAGANGVTATTISGGGAGGAGVSTVTNWGSLSAALTTTGTGVSGFIAGGGGGSADTNAVGAGGSGGGGAGGKNTSTPPAVSGTANTGSGGGGSTNVAYAAGNGGSGIVIVRYAV